MIESVTLEEVKKSAIEIIRRQMEMSELMLSLDKNEIEEFNQWYKNNWYYNKLQEFLQFIQQLKQNS